MKSVSMMGRLILISALVLSAVGITLADDANVSIGEVDEAAYGVAITNASWVDEWVEITNLGETDQDFTGWTLSDEQNHVYDFPEGFVLEGGWSVVVHTGVGDDSATDLYMNQGNPVWNNDGDVATLIDEEGNIVSQYPAPEDGSTET